ncbi:glycine betaine ABC transporter substrate-binding protein [Mycetocola miduiensis]|uniref:Osmoprotectant transport system substrate-binding protein n=1 Tax=Mycetocola miduiensis TaxID=995034 RepID=A0A1I5AI36_9MICO|nr:glycine betaine ABC transporter substrate-binding protein [Mycetocola miduiensis]SFN62093.1 osmoprotectant transport system substrate-binding protein [Mycetocola miduiensis]
MKKNLTAGLAVAAAGALLLSGCSGASASSSSSAGDELEGLTGQIGSKDFSEQYILAHITTELLNAHGADLEANTKLVGSANTRAALVNDEFVGYWEYTGTAWITYQGNTAAVKGAEAQFEAVKEADAAEGIAWLDPAPFNNTYAFATRADTAKELGITTLSDVAGLPGEKQTFCIESEFSTRDDGWTGVSEAYGFGASESNVTLLDTGLIYTATEKAADCTFGEVFTTDGRIAALDLVVLEDDKEFFPTYQGAFTVKESTLKKYPEIADIIAEISPLLTTEEMQKLNALVDVDGEEPEDVAIDWLTEQGLI